MIVGCIVCICIYTDMGICVHIFIYVQVYIYIYYFLAHGRYSELVLMGCMTIIVRGAIGIYELLQLRKKICVFFLRFLYYLYNPWPFIYGSIYSHQLLVFSEYPDSAIFREHQQGFLERSDMHHLTITDANKHRV